ncbi:hypothetical protein WJX84_012224 [Apatococcus fuscideae]|uniref:Mannose-P-dolichol utilization defect 1 protein homolog n=1 Tax=Apatococcus fuscideae TaxID=2026836 RepID=A0AAW1RMQ8_9CHLO
MSGSDQDTWSLIQVVLQFASQGSIPPQAVLTLLLSKLLGYLIIAGACYVKVPQILALRKAKSAEGLSASAFELEQIGYSIHSTYGFIMGLPFTAFGEAIIMLLQNTLLICQVYYYSKAPIVRPLGLILLFAGLGFYVTSGALTQQQMMRAYDFNNIIFTAARLPQIVKNFRAKSTGQLSIVTYVFNLGGCVIRIFTSIQEGAGIAMVRGFILGLALNGMLVFQCLYYGNKSPAAPKAGSKTSKIN